MKINEEVERLLTIIGAGGLAGLLVGVARGVILAKHGGWGAFFRGLVASVLVAVLVALAIDDMGLSATKQGAIIGLCAYVADDVLLSLVTLAKIISSDPMGFIRDFIGSLRGGKK